MFRNKFCGKGVPIFFLSDISLRICLTSEVPCRADDVSTASFYYHAASKHHLPGGHKSKLGLICPKEKISEPLLWESERCSDNRYKRNVPIMGSFPDTVLEVNMKTIGLSKAQTMISAKVNKLESIQVQLQDALGHVVAADMVAQVDCPSVNASLKDGFAVRAADLAQADMNRSIALKLVGGSSAGGQVQSALGSGQTLRVMTGAPLPSQVDAVVPLEHVIEDNETIRFEHSVEPGQDILTRGSDVARNQTVAKAGDTATPGLLGLLAAAGHSHLNIVRPPRIAIISTGDEVVALGSPLPEGKLYASNLSTLDAWCQALGFGTSCLIVGDDAADTTHSIENVMAWADAVITSGGAWGSDRDRVVGALEILNWEQLFHGVRMRPGKGSGFGLLEDKPVFVLPGGPSANLTAFLQLALPGLQQMAGYHQKGLSEVIAELESEIKGRHVDWSAFVFGKLQGQDRGYRFEPLNIHSRLQSIAKADSLAIIPEGHAEVQAGSQIRVQILTC